MSGGDQLGFSFPVGAPRRVWSVRELVSAVRTAVEREYTDVWLEGEISNYRPSESGHLYFTLKDGDAQLRVVMFRSQARLLRFRPDNGMQIIARGRVTIYDARGELQVAAEYLEPKGAGALQVAFDQLKARLEAEGLFAQERKKPLPAFPRRIAIVTSPRGAAVQDMLNILRRRHAGVGVLVFPAQVQGEAAAAEVAAGIRFFNRSGLPETWQVDVIVVARGGGSIEDLAAFNDEALARTIAESHIPVISAVGHETDFTIADFVADLRAPTPSAAAELVIESEQQISERIATLRQRLSRAARYRLLVLRNRLAQLAEKGTLQRMADVVRRRQQRLDELHFRLAQAEAAQLGRYRRRVDVAAARIRHLDMRRVLAGMRHQADRSAMHLVQLTRRTLAEKRARLERAASTLNALSPNRILERGYAVVFDASGRLVRDAAQVVAGDVVETRVAKGSFKSTVN